MYGHRMDGKPTETELLLHVYDLQPDFNKSCYNMGLGFYHSGIQVGMK